MPGLHLCAVVVTSSDPRGEYVEVGNDASTPALLTGRKLTDYTATQQNVHIIEFPGAPGGGELTLGSGKSAYVFTGRGTNERTDDGHLLLFVNRGASVWNDSGDVAYLRESNGQFIDSMTVGDPKRHPNGH